MRSNTGNVGLNLPNVIFLFHRVFDKVFGAFMATEIDFISKSILFYAFFYFWSKKFESIFIYNINGGIQVVRCHTSPTSLILFIFIF
jgi:hypothetical protein